MLGNRGLILVSIAADMPWAVDKETCRLVADHNVNAVLLMSCFEEVCFGMLQKGTKRIAGKGH